MAGVACASSVTLPLTIENVQRKSGHGSFLQATGHKYLARPLSEVKGSMMSFTSGGVLVAPFLGSIFVAPVCVVFGFGNCRLQAHAKLSCCKPCSFLSMCFVSYNPWDII